MRHGYIEGDWRSRTLRPHPSTQHRNLTPNVPVGAHRSGLIGMTYRLAGYKPSIIEFLVQQRCVTSQFKVTPISRNQGQELYIRVGEATAAQARSLGDLAILAVNNLASAGIGAVGPAVASAASGVAAPVGAGSGGGAAGIDHAGGAVVDAGGAGGGSAPTELPSIARLQHEYRLTGLGRQLHHLTHSRYIVDVSAGGSPNQGYACLGTTEISFSELARRVAVII